MSLKTVYSFGSDGIVQESTIALDANDEAYLIQRAAELQVRENKEFLIYDYVDGGQYTDSTTSPKSINYKTQINKKFVRSETFNDQGELTEVIYYEDKNGDGTKDNPVLKASFNYTRDALGNVKKRDDVRTWYLKDGNPSGDTKSSTKYYEGGKVVQEGIRRRENIVRNLEIQTLGIIMVTQSPADDTEKAVLQANGLAFMGDNDSEFSRYVKAQNMDILAAIDAAYFGTYIWIDDVITQTVIDYGIVPASCLNVTVRNYMKNTLDKINI